MKSCFYVVVLCDISDPLESKYDFSPCLLALRLLKCQCTMLTYYKLTEYIQIYNVSLPGKGPT